MRLPVEFAMFSAGAGLLLFFFGAGMALFLVFGQGAAAFPFWSLELAAAGFGLFLLTVLVYFLRFPVQFIRQRGVAYDPFFSSLPLEGEEHPEDAGDLFDDAFEFLSGRWPHLTVLLIASPLVLRVLSHSPAGRSLFHADLGPIHDGGTHWSVADVTVLGGGSVLVLFIVAMAARRIWAMQNDEPPSQRPDE